ncbi:3-oxoacyl-ACP reductase [Acinetobacter proteolyticus]|uniref:SDR family NAD(P)-dependent oxidoreductase n=1 Tax=Acinetobacter proteolyticus TaxID=1776741 RepID=UPI0008635131|nr:SDR family oxidoreductase [Acinetobacter proteolyticus]OEY95496.1 3-oxoacyl-ACP reductase [Acinetobacter proteolyticus]
MDTDVLDTENLISTLAIPNTGVVITGGASGIGLAVAKTLAAVGRPIAIWDINLEKAKNSAATISKQFNIKAIGIGINIMEVEAYDDAIEKSRKALGSLGGLVHCAGIVDTGSLEGITLETWAAGIDTHLRPLAFLSQKLYRDFTLNKGSAIVTIASINATLGNAINPIYSAAKGGMLSLVRSLADRLARDNIRINSVSPGQIHTPMVQASLDSLPENFFEKRILLGRLGQPEEIGRVVRFLLSDEASYITAAEIVVDGGNISSQRG